MEQGSGLYFFRHGEIPKRSGQDIPPGAHNYDVEFDQDYGEGDPFYIPPEKFSPDERIVPGRHRVLKEAQRKGQEAYEKALENGLSEEDARQRQAEAGMEEANRILVVRQGALENIEEEAKSFQLRIQHLFASDVPRAYQSAAVFREARPEDERSIDIGVEAGFGELPQAWGIIKQQKLEPGTQRYEVIERLLNALDKVVPLAEKEVVAVFAHNGIKKALWDIFLEQQVKGKFQYATPDQFDLVKCKERMEYWRNQLKQAKEKES